MKIIVRLMLVSVLMLVAAPAFSAEATQMWKCELDDDASEEDVMAQAREWLQAAKKLEGGQGLKASVLFPVAVNVTGQTDLMFIVTAPSFEAWGKFWDNYVQSPAAELEDRHDQKVVCPDSAVWESIKVQ
jgi:hypothetical protein